MRKPVHAAPAAQPVFVRTYSQRAWRVLTTTRRAWRGHALPRPDFTALPPDERVRRLGEW
ncbi:hypothetical protein [Ottowia sp.]|uniref:hypothetical protein n=1 Tax=Ottowia sp. TaxID=1898956 RepID=UPI003A8364B0